MVLQIFESLNFLFFCFIIINHLTSENFYIYKKTSFITLRQCRNIIKIPRLSQFIVLENCCIFFAPESSQTCYSKILIIFQISLCDIEAYRRVVYMWFQLQNNEFHLKTVVSRSFSILFNGLVFYQLIQHICYSKALRDTMHPKECLLGKLESLCADHFLAL